MATLELKPLVNDIQRLDAAKTDLTSNITASITVSYDIEEGADYAVMTITSGSALTGDDLKNAQRVREQYLANPIEGGPGFKGVSITHSSGTLTVQSEIGQSFSVSRTGYIKFPSVDRAGEFFTAAAQSASLDASIDNTDLNGVEFGATSGRAWGEDRRLYIWAINKDDDNANVKLFISGYFKTEANESPASTGSNYGKIGSLPSGTGWDTWVALSDDAGLTPTDYAGKPMVCLGMVKATMSSGNVWSFTTLDEESGVGQFGHEIIWTFPKGHGLADANSYFYTDGPSFSDETYLYRVHSDGDMSLNCKFSSSPVTNGTGTGDIRIALPIHPPTTIKSWYLPPMERLRVSGTVRQSPRLYIFSTYAKVVYTAQSTYVDCNDFSSNNDSMIFQFRYPVYD